MKVTGIILAGGKSTRFGRNKAMELLSGKKLVQYVYDCLKPLTEQVLVVTSKELASLTYPEGTEVLTDIYPGKGPLSGIYTGLSSAKYERGIVVGCDMPFLNTKLLRFMAELSPDLDAVIPRLSQVTVEPLHAVYAKSCLGKIKTQLEHNQTAVYALFPALRIRYVDREECQGFDPQLLSFLNIDCQADFDRAIYLSLKAGSFKPHSQPG